MIQNELFTICPELLHGCPLGRQGLPQRGFLFRDFDIQRACLAGGLLEVLSHLGHRRAHFAVDRKNLCIHGDDPPRLLVAPRGLSLILTASQKKGDRYHAGNGNHGRRTFHAMGSCGVPQQKVKTASYCENPVKP